MNLYTKTVVFYLVSFAAIYLLNKLSPNQHDGGLGFGSLAIILFVLIILILMVVNLVKGFKDSSRYLLAGIHLLALLLLVGKLFL